MFVVVVVVVIAVVKHVNKGLKVPDFERNSTKMNLTLFVFFFIKFEMFQTNDKWKMNFFFDKNSGC